MASKRYVQFVGYVGAFANWTIPIAAMTSIASDSPSKVNPTMSTILGLYSCVFMRWALSIYPANYPLLACHLTNAICQFTQVGRSVQYQLSDRPASLTSSDALNKLGDE